MSDASENGARGVRERTVLLAGGTSEAGRVTADVLLGLGAHAIVVGRDDAKLEAARAHAPALHTERCDLTVEGEVDALANRLADAGTPVDGILHLVGGWRGGGGLAGQTEEDYRFLERSFTALRHVSRAFDTQVRASEAGRLAIVSSTAVTRPLAGGANYASLKAAAETWTQAVAHGYAKAARDADEPLRAAATIFRITALAGLEFALADAFSRLWDDAPDALNGAVITLG